MIATERHERILKELELHGALRVADFADRLGVSGMTLRRDLAVLAERGLLARVHGGAVPVAVAHAQGGEAGSSAYTAGRPLATIGMVVPSATYYYPDVIAGAKEAVRELGCRLVLGVSDYSSATEAHQAQRLVAGGVDGLLVTPTGSLADDTELHRVLTTASVPVVLVERTVDDDLGASGLESVRSDHRYGAELAVAHLAALGHSRIALAARETPTTAPVREGHSRALARLGLDTASPVCLLERSAHDGASPRALAAFLDTIERAEARAAVVLTDVDAISLVEVAADRGIRVPEDLAVVAYDDEVASLARVPLTAIAPAKADLGYVAATMCFRRIQAPVGVRRRAAQRVMLLPELVVRESSVPDSAEVRNER